MKGYKLKTMWSRALRVFHICVLILGIPLLIHSQQLSRYQFDQPHMGTVFRIILYAENEDEAEELATMAFDRVNQLDEMLSDYLPHSELNRLSANAGKCKWVSVSPELWEVLRVSQEIADLTEGAFDVSIGPLSKLWRKAFRHFSFPGVDEIARAKEKVNYQNIRLKVRSKKVKLKKTGMQLDLGGIAKGYALDEAMRILKDNGIQHALVDGGGDILVSKAPPGRDNWKIAYNKFDDNGELKSDSLFLENAAVATSGGTFRFLEWEGKCYSHIIHPGTGLGISEERLVTVIGPSGILADALASAFSVIDEKDRKRISGAFPEFEIQVFNKRKKDQ